MILFFDKVHTKNITFATLLYAFIFFNSLIFANLKIFSINLLIFYFQLTINLIKNHLMFYGIENLLPKKVQNQFVKIWLKKIIIMR